MNNYNKNIDISLATNFMHGDGIGRHSAIIDILYDQFSINAYQFQPTKLSGFSKETLKVAMKSFDGWGKICYWNYILGLDEKIIEIHKSITSPLKIAFSVFEASSIPQLWTKILNEYYHLLIVPDPYLVDVYKNSGVNIPIFVIPLGVEVEKLLEKPIKTKASDPFVFGMSGGFWARKNHIKVLQAFGEKFGNDPKFKLKLHGRFGSYKSEVIKAVKNANYSNVELITSPLSTDAYNQFMNEINCYVFVSGAEGFSITPRETLALGIPTILSNNSAHKTICDSGFVIPIQTPIKTPAIFEVFGNKQIGYYSDCTASDLANKMKEVVDHYDKYLEQAEGGREWVKQYLWPNLKAQYCNLFNPKEIVEGKTNLITDQFFQTSDTKLLFKMKEVFK